jgi:hypothetical protein
MIPNVELQSLVGAQVMSATSVLSALGFRCIDISRQTLHPGHQPAGTFLCTLRRDGDAKAKPLTILLHFSEQGVVTAVIPSADRCDS